MPFPFSFSFHVPGITNPFLAPLLPPSPTRTEAETPPSAQASEHVNDRYPEERIKRRAPSPCLTPPQPLSRKRGWVPSNTEPSLAATVSANTSGYLDTPAKYRDMARSHEDEEDELVADLPPPKRRRTLAGSIVSTALSAALIGTAVGLTVYRLWRNRGKQPEALPPPPYEQGDYVPPSPHPDSRPQQQIEYHIQAVPDTKVIPPTPRSSRRTQRHIAGAGRRTPRHRKTPSRVAAHYSPPRMASPPSSYSPPSTSTAAAFRFGDEEDEGPMDEVSEQMDWMSDRLAKLIEEGKRALGTEVVVMSESREDEVDDGSGAWVEDDAENISKRPSTSSLAGSFRRGRSKPKHLPLPSYSPPAYASHSHTSSFTASHSFASPQSSPRKARFDGPSSSRGVSVESDRLSVLAGRDEDDNLTPELRESMEKARLAYRQKLGLS